MTDYHPLLWQAIAALAEKIAALAENNDAARRALYERARAALLTKLHAVKPPLGESEITRERLALEEAIRRIEAEYTVTHLAQSSPRAAEERPPPILRRRSRLDPLAAPPLDALASRLEPPAPPVAAEELHEPRLDGLSESRSQPPPPSARYSRVPLPPTQVEFGISHPDGVAAGVPFIIDTWIYQNKDRMAVLRRARVSLRKIKTGGSAALARGTKVSIKLEVDSWNVDPPKQVIVWNGQITSIPFAVSPDQSLSSDTVIGKCSYFVKGLRICQIPFSLSVKSTTPKDVSVIPASPIASAFASYASKDRRSVIARVQGMEKLGVRVFIDVRDLKSGDPYPTHLLKQIDSSDVLYLFWSKYAKQSSWVEKEWRYGLTHKVTCSP